MNKYICIHGHFYQPPRENAWLEEIELQESAHPYHDWNERITNECYGPNGVSRILNDEGKIVDIVNNYAKMSFNFGPTLLSWMQKKRSKEYQYILEADKLSLELFNGHGSAIAQVYNHIIMPLATRRDKETQVKWGIYDFVQRFERQPKGMWLAETAVDTETLEILAENGIEFTVLAPRQAKQYRKISDCEWTEGINPNLPYRFALPSGREIVLFFYDGPRSQGVAFSGVLNDGKRFAKSLTSGFNEDATATELLHIATDGESYGHHHTNGDMALAYCIRHIETEGLARVTNYSEFLSLVDVEHEVEIHENSSWSCAHGVERWRSDCGCQTGGDDTWNQAWRKGLRDALNWLRDTFDGVFEEEMSVFHKDCWKLRNAYIDVLFDRSRNKIQTFLDKHFHQDLQASEKTKIIRLLEMQKQSMYMFTSCGWFFNEVSGIETIQILQYANRGIQLAEREADVLIEKAFIEQLSLAKSNLPDHQDAGHIYRQYVMPKRLSLTKVGMHYAVTSLFSDTSEVMTILNYDCTSEVFERFTSGMHILAIGRTSVKSNVTLSQKHFSFVILYLDNHHLVGNTSNKLLEEEYSAMVQQIKAAFQTSNISQVMDVMAAYFPSKRFSFFNLFKDEQIKVLSKVLDRNVSRAINSYEKINERNYGLINIMSSSNLTIPFALRKNLETVLAIRLKQLMTSPSILIDINLLQRTIQDIQKWKFPIDYERFNFLSTRSIGRLITFYNKTDQKQKVLDNLYETLSCLRQIDLNPAINELQNFVFHLIREKAFTEQEEKSVYRLAEMINLAFF